MIEFTDAGGDLVRTFIGTTGQLAGSLFIECTSSSPDAWGDDEPVSPALDRKMARTLAADLLAFADSQETPETGE
jgi:hypothetical protein